VSEAGATSAAVRDAILAGGSVNHFVQITEDFDQRIARTAKRAGACLRIVLTIMCPDVFDMLYADCSHIHHDLRSIANQPLGTER
jgi:hypothetical protein